MKGLAREGCGGRSIPEPADRVAASRIDEAVIGIARHTYRSPVVCGQPPVTSAASWMIGRLGRSVRREHSRTAQGRRNQRQHVFFHLSLSFPALRAI